MAQLPEPGPSTSYSDPIYDRLESVAQRLTRRIGWVVAMLIVVVAVAVLIRTMLRDSKEPMTGHAYLKAAEERDETKRREALKAVVEDATSTPFFRAVALFELTQEALKQDQIPEAKVHAGRATEAAKAALDDDLILAARLNQAAVTLQAKDYDAAAQDYDAVERAAGAKRPDRALAATIGLATVYEAQGKPDEAIAKLETVISRTDSGAEGLLNLARQQYWRLKRQAAEKALAPAAPNPAAPAPAASALPEANAAAAAQAASGTPTAPATTAPPAPTAPTSTAPAAPAAPTATPK
jgi:hypothetical protein